MTRRRGFSYVEVHVALALFGIAMAGLGSVVLSQLRMMEAIERRVLVQVPLGTTLSVARDRLPIGGQDRLVATATGDARSDWLRSADAWARKLGVPAPLVVAPTLPGVETPVSAYPQLGDRWGARPPSHAVTLESYEPTLGTAVVRVQPSGAEP